MNDDIEMGKPETRLQIRVTIRRGDTVREYKIAIESPTENIKHWTFVMPKEMQKEQYLEKLCWDSPEGISMAEAIQQFRQWLEGESRN